MHVTKPTTRPQGDSIYLAILDEMRDLHLRKGCDYGDEADSFENIVAGAKILGMEPWLGAMVRFFDKVQRMKKYIQRGSLANDTIENDLMDGAAYLLIALALRRRGTCNTPSE
jgi:hypothetical protein